MNAICLCIDRLHSGYLGAYGNSWVETPAFDRLASESLVCDFAYIESPDLAQLYEACIGGLGPVMRSNPNFSPQPLEKLLAQRGVHTAFLSDEPSLILQPSIASWDDVVSLDLRARQTPAETLDDVHLTRCFATAIDHLTRLPQPFLLWIHLRGMDGPWDAPYAYRSHFAAEDDPPPPESTLPPSTILEADYDPDLVLGVAQSYAGQIVALDTCIGALLEAIVSQSTWDPTLLALFSARGFPLGEHHRLGPCDEALYGELLQVPLMVRAPGRLDIGYRSPALTTPGDLYATLRHWFLETDDTGASEGAGDSGNPSATRALRPQSLLRLIQPGQPAWRDRLISIGSGEQCAIRTPAWFLRGHDEATGLFAKPDDRWEANNVAERCPEVVAKVQDVMLASLSAARKGDFAGWPELDGVLIEGLE